MQVPDRIHISPLGFERDRVVLPAMEYKADQVLLLEHDEPADEKPWYHDELKEDLRDAGIEVRSIQCDIFDLYTVLGQIAELITQHAEDEVYVNLSTGSKISGIGGMIACMVTRDEANVTPFYVTAEGYNPDVEADEKPVSYGMAGISELPTYPIQGPSRDEIVMLASIAEQEAVTKKQLIRQARWLVDRFRRNAEEKDIEPGDDPFQGEYRLLDTHVLDPLGERGWIEITEVGRSKEVSITPEGRNTLRAFEYLKQDGDVDR